MESRRLFLAVLLSLVVLIGWQMLVGPPPPPAGTPQDEVGEVVADREVTPERGEPLEGRIAEERTGPGSGDEADDGAEETVEQRPEIRASREETRILESERVRAVFTNRGAQLLSFELKDHRRTGGAQVDLVRARRSGPYPYGLQQDGGEHPLNQVLFQVESLEEGLRFEYSGPEGQAVKEFRFASDPAGSADDLLAARVTVSGPRDWFLVIGPGLRNTSAAERKENRFERRRGIYKVAGDVEEIDASDASERQAVGGGGLEWVGLDDNYFLAVMLFDPTSLEKPDAVFSPVLLLPGAGDEGGEGQPEGVAFQALPPAEQMTDAQKGLERELLLLLRPRGEQMDTLAYWGAKQLERLNGLSLPGTTEKGTAQLDHTIELSFLRLLAEPMLMVLHWIYDNVVHNYGWAIVLMTVLLKLLLFPFTHKAHASMRKMQEVQPKINALRAKYKPKLKGKDGKPNMEAQRKMNEEMMALFREEGVNPAGGCWPMLLQMPFFFAFYFILREAVELRNAPWLWVSDLSMPEPTAIHFLPLIMGVTQFLQQRLTPMAGDAMQRRLFQFLPVFFLFLFWGMPSGLVLYWLTNNVLTIAQQSIYNHLKQRNAPGDAPEPKKSGSRKGGRGRSK